MVDKSRFRFNDKFKSVTKAFDENSTCMLELFEGCEEPAVSSHSVSATNLRMIADNHEVVRCGFDLTQTKRTNYIQFRKVSPRIASTFPGFCSEHDQQIFREIDVRNFKISPESLALYMYRATAQELYKKGRNLAVYGSIHEIAPNGRIVVPDDLRYAKLGTELGFQDAYQHLTSIRDIVDSGDYSSIRYVCFKFAHVVPYAYLGAVNFRYFPQYNEFELLDESRDEGCTIGVIPHEGGSIFFIVWRKGYERILSPIFKRFKLAKRAMIEFAFQFGFEHFENIFFKPIWFDSLDKNRREFFREFMMKNIGANVADPALRPFDGLFDEYPSAQPKLSTNSSSFRMKFK